MARDGNGSLYDTFAAVTQNVTPASASCVGQVLYAPRSFDRALSERCASVLSASELQRAGLFVTQEGKENFIQRRAFQRFCGALVHDAGVLLSRVVFARTAKGRPYLPCLPDIWFSFASSRRGFLAAWSSSHGIGIDIEAESDDPDITKLARSYFSGAEAIVVENSVGSCRLQNFFRLWTLKEAALKSVGEGMPFGLDAFHFELTPRPAVVKAPREHGGPERFAAHAIEGTDSLASVVTRTR